jgi:hypothetical protein
MLDYLAISPNMVGNLEQIKYLLAEKNEQGP